MKMGLPKRSLALLALVCIAFSLTFFFAAPSTNFKPSSLMGDSFVGRPARPTCVRNTATLDGMELSKQQWTQCLEPGAEPSVYLSIVLVTRMDDYAGNQHHRLQNFIDSTYLLAERTKIKMELLLIEWNPPSNRRRVLDAFRFRQSEYLTHRIITVPKTIHDALPNVGNAPLHEFEGKNVGIRFARGEYIVCTNQDDIWSHNFHNAVQSRAFKENVIYLQHQDRHNIHNDLPPSIVNLPAFTNDDALYHACKLNDQIWGEFELPPPVNLQPENYLRIGDQAGDFTMAHRNTWQRVRGYRESGGIAWVDIEFIITAAWTFDIPVVHSRKGFTCHQEHENVWENHKEMQTDNKNIDIRKVQRKEVQYVNKDQQWALLHFDVWEMGLGCIQFSGGVCW